jgi:hypothetical protein
MEASRPFWQRETIIPGLFSVGAAYLFFYAALLMIQIASLFTRIGLRNAGTVLAASITIGFFGWVVRRVYRLSVPQFAFWLLIMLLIIILSGFIAGYFLDLSWDGRDYHQKAVRELVAGWNPIYIVMQPQDVYDNAWLNHYPKGSWISAAAIYQLTRDIEIGKIFNQLLMWAVFFIGFAYFLTYPQLQLWKAFLLALFLAANPVSMSQFLSYYADGQVSSLIIALILLLLLSLRRDDPGVWVTLAATIIIALNVKFTGTAYASLALVIFFPASWYIKRRLSLLLPVWLAIGVGVVFGVFFVGFTPYVFNTVRHGHPFYPIISSSQFNKTFVLRGQMPPNFTNVNRIEKLYLSVFSRSQNKVGKPGHLKNPFTVLDSEISSFKDPDVRIGGWGPLFGALAILSAGAMVILLLVSRRTALVASLLIGAILFVTLLNSDSWWARYAPQLWLIPVLVLSALWLIKNKWLTVIGLLLASAMLVNMLLISNQYISFNIEENRYSRTTMNSLQEDKKQIILYNGPLEATGVRLREYGIPYLWVEHRSELPCPEKLEMWVYYSPVDCTP